MTVALDPEIFGRPCDWQDHFLLDVLVIRARTRAYLIRQCEMDFHETVDRLWQWAVARDLVDMFGPDLIQKIFSDHFGDEIRRLEALDTENLVEVSE